MLPVDNIAVLFSCSSSFEDLKKEYLVISCWIGFLKV
jgi:hypothetical protein